MQSYPSIFESESHGGAESAEGPAGRAVQSQAAQPGVGQPSAESGPVSALHPKHQLLEDAREVLRGQSAALEALARTLDGSFADAVELIQSRPGRVVVCGMGKSGLVGRKIAATLSSTGTPAFFLHASEALHGDLGMVTPEDTVILISHSGRTKEILSILPALQDLGVPMIAICSGGHLAHLADVTLTVQIVREACPHNLVPTTSSLVTLALGDALALALSQARGFAKQDFARFHPGGDLGRKLHTRVYDVMNHDELPVVAPDTPLPEVLAKMTDGQSGLAIVEESGRKLAGIITDGDVRRALQTKPDLLKCAAHQIMTQHPLVISAEASMEQAESLMVEHQVKALLVTDHSSHVCGIVEFFAK